MDIKDKYNNIYRIESKRYKRVGICYCNVIMDIDIKGIKKEEEEKEIKGIIKNIIKSKYILIDKVKYQNYNRITYNNILVKINKIIGIELYEDEYEKRMSIYGEYEITNNEEIFRDVKKNKWNSYKNQKERWENIKGKERYKILYESKDIK